MPRCGRLWLWLEGYRGRKEMYHLLSLIVSAVSELCKATAYHPERHYMRGPGPKWREKHEGKIAELIGAVGLPALADRIDEEAHCNTMLSLPHHPQFGIPPPIPPP